MRAMAGASIGASGGLPITTSSRDDPVGVVGHLGLVSELHRPAERPLRMGRASGSCKDTTRVAPSGISPATRSRVWADDLFHRGRGHLELQRCTAAARPGGAPRRVQVRRALTATAAGLGDGRLGDGRPARR